MAAFPNNQGFIMAGLLLSGVLIYSAVTDNRIFDVISGHAGNDGTHGDVPGSAQDIADSQGNTVGRAIANVADVGTTPKGVSIPAAPWNPGRKPIARWIVPILDWASRNGWSGVVTSGYRTQAQQLVAATAYGLSHYANGDPSGSNHTKANYPGGAVDVSNASQLNQVLSHYPATPNLVWGGPVMGDEVHFSATGH